MADRSGGELSSITGETLEKAKKELFEVPEQREEKVAELRAKIAEREAEPEWQDIIFERKDGPFLLRFLRARKFNVERAAQLYYNYYRYRHKYSHLFCNFHPRALEHVLRSGMLLPYGPRRKDGSSAIVLRPARWDTESVPFADNFRTLMLLLERLIEEEENQVHGLAILNDMQDVSFATILQVSQTEQMQRAMIVELLQECFPCRFKGLHLLNQPWYVSLVLSLMRPFMKRKMKDRLHLHGDDLCSLHEHFVSSTLPESLGGSAPDLDELSAVKLFETELSANTAADHPQD